MTSTAPASRLPWAARLAARESVVIRWAPTLPPLTDAAADAVAHAHGIRLAQAPDAPDPWDVRSFAGLFAQARADQVLRALSSRTNLVLSGTTTRVVGDGPIADALAAALTRIGSRVIRASADPRTRLRAELAGLGTDPAAHAHQTIATGEGHGPVDPGTVTGLLVDAAPRPGTGFAAGAGEPARPGVVRAGEREAWIVDVPPPFADDPDPSQRRMLDALVTLSLLSGAGDLDRAFAEAVLS